MAEAKIDIGLRVDMAEAAKLESLPKSIQARWAEVSKALREVNGLTGAARERVTRSQERVSALLGKVETQGGFTSAQRKDFEQNFKLATRILDRGFTEQIAIVKTRGNQLLQEMDALGARIRAARGAERDALTRQQGQLWRDKDAYFAAGGDQAAAQKARAARQQFRSTSHEIGDIAALIPIVTPGQNQAVQQQLKARGANTFAVQMQQASGQARAVLQKHLNLAGGGAGAATGTVAGAAAATGATAAIGAATKAGATAGAATGTVAGAKAGATVAAAGLGGGLGSPGGGVPSNPAITGAAAASVQVAQAAQQQRSQQGQQQGQQQGMGFGARFASQFVRGMVPGLAMAGIGYVAASFVRRQFSGELERGMRVSDLAQRVRPQNMPYQEFRQQAKALSPSFTPDESTQFLERYGELAGAENLLPSRGRQGAAREAADVTRRLGFTPEEGAERFGRARQLGMAGGEQGQKKFAELLANAVAQGQMRGRQGEVFESILRLGEAVAGRTGRAMNEGPIAGILARFGETGLPGLKGQFGASVIERVDTSVQGGQVLPKLPPQMITAMAMQTFPGKRLEDIDEMLQGGLSAFPEEISKVIKTALDRVGNTETGKAMVANLFGIPLGARKEVFAAIQGGAGPEKIKGALAGAAETPEAKIRETLASLKQKEADIVEKLIPLYGSVMTGVSNLITGFSNLASETKNLSSLWESLGTLWQPLGSFLKSLGLGSGVPTAGRIGRGVVTGQSTTAPPDINAGVPQWILDWFGDEPTKKSGSRTRIEEALKNAKDPATRARLQGALGGTATQPPDLTSKLSDWATNWFKDWYKSASTETSLKDKSLPDSVLNALSQHGANVSGLSPELIRSVIQQESRGNPNAVSKKGAGGLMQLMPGTFPGMSDAERFDPVKNVEAGSEFLRKQVDKFGSIEKGLAAYNAGPGAVQKYGGVPPFDETQGYVKAIEADTMRRMGKPDERWQSQVPQNIPAFAHAPEQKHSMSIDPLTIVIRNEKGELLDTQQAPLKASSLSDFNLSTMPGGSGMHAQSTSPFFGNYQ